MSAAELFVEAISDPASAQEGARRIALRSDLTPDEFKLLRGILQPWWDTEKDARTLCSYLGERAATEGKGSVAHRCSVRIVVLCAKAALSLVREQDRVETTQILNTIDAWASGGATESDFLALRNRAQELWSDTNIAAFNSVFHTDAAATNAGVTATIAANAARAVALTAEIANDATSNVALTCAAAAAATSNAVDLLSRIATTGSPLSPELTEANDHLSVLADMIRSEIPVCPVGLP